MQQGVFRTERLRSGEVGFINGYENRNLAQGMTQQAAAGAGLTPAELQDLSSGAPVPLDRFRNLVDKLDRHSGLFQEAVQ